MHLDEVRRLGKDNFKYFLQEICKLLLDSDFEDLKEAITPLNFVKEIVLSEADIVKYELTGEYEESDYYMVVNDTLFLDSYQKASVEDLKELFGCILEQSAHEVVELGTEYGYYKEEKVTQQDLDLGEDFYIEDYDPEVGDPYWVINDYWFPPRVKWVQI